jgi:NAD(P)-dependent dehydrogenase (short-subunit alcohol dehydrogenase family)
MTGTSHAVLVTGASAGIGHACALDLARHGFRVYGGVRTREDGEALQAASNGRVQPLTLDVTEREHIAGARRALTVALDDDGLCGLVNNAGAVYAGPLEHLDPEALREQFDVNVFGAIALTQAMLPLLRVGRGRVVNVSSVNGRIVSPFSGAYAASKFALEALSDALRMELARVRAGVRVIVVQPGAIQTRIWETSRQRALALAAALPPEAHDHYPRLLDRLRRTRMPPGAAPPERVASVIRRALTTRWPRTRYQVGWDARIGIVLGLLLPGRILDFIMVGRRG